jgi:hypothetical protein
MSYFSDFDGLTKDDLKDYFSLDDTGAGWILHILKENQILQLKTVEMKRFDLPNILKKLEEKPKDTDSDELKLVYKDIKVIKELIKNKKLLNITQDLTQFFFKILEEKNKKLYDFSIENKFLVPYEYKIWRLNSKIDCSCLPPCVADHIDELLADRFTYSFALEELCLSLEKANKEPLLNTLRQIFIAENPFNELYDDFIHYGLAIPSRILTSSENFEYFITKTFRKMRK